MLTTRPDFIKQQVNNGKTPEQAEQAYREYIKIRTGYYPVDPEAYNAAASQPDRDAPLIIGQDEPYDMEIAPTKPKNRWNYYLNKWQTKTDSGWVENKVKSKAKSTSKEAFIKRFLKADSYADLARFYVWPISKVKGYRTRINTQLKEAGVEHQLPKLPNFTDAQQRTYNDQKDEGFTSSKDTLANLFKTK